jgi:uncharacterized protein (TIGR03663 family)
MTKKKSNDDKSTPNPFWQTTSKVVLILLAITLLFGVWIRLQGLGRKAFHHDESLHAYYGFRIYDQGRINNSNPNDIVYKYDPVYHGPLLYHISAFVFFLFGDNNTTARLPIALCGIYMIYLAWLLFSREKDSSRWWAMAFVGISPTLIYFARFDRMDTYAATCGLGLLVHAIRYWKWGRDRDFYATVLFLVFMYCTKENSYMTGFVLGASAVAYGLIRIFDRQNGGPEFLRKALCERTALTQLLLLYGLFSLFAFLYARFYFEINLSPGGKYYSLWGQFPGKHFGGWLNMFIGDPKQGGSTVKWLLAHWGGFSITFWFIFIAIAVALLVLLHRLRYSKHGEGVVQSADKKDKTPVDSILSALVEHSRIIIALAVIIFVYSFLFTTMFASVPGRSIGQSLTMGVRDYISHWFGAHQTERLAGTPLYYYYRLLVYEPAYLALGLTGALLFLLGQARTILFPREEDSDNSQHLMFFMISSVVGMIFFLFFFKALLGVSMGKAIGIGMLAGVMFYPFILLFRHRPLWAFLIFWSIANLLIYSQLGEKAPWLLTHHALPLALLSAAVMGELMSRVRTPGLRTLLLIPIGLLLIFEVRSAIFANIYYEDDGRETIVYVQTAPEIRELIKEIDEIAMKSGKFERLPYVVANEVEWPFAWYLRHYTNRQSEFRPQGAAIVIEHADLGGAKHENMKLKLGDGYTFKKMRLQNWWDNIQQRLNSNGRPGVDYFVHPVTRRLLIEYFLYRKPWNFRGNMGNPIGSKDIYVYIKKDAVEKDIAPKKDTRKYPEGAKALPMSLRVDRTYGTNGTAAVRFQEPRGLSWAGGKLYVSNSKANTVVVLDQNGKQVAVYGGPGKLDVPNAVAGDPAGGCWVADTWHHRIVHYAADGSVLGEYQPPQSDSFFAPRGIALSKQGGLVLTDTGKHVLKMFDGSGSFVRTVGLPGALKGQFSEPVGIAIAQNGSIYVADTGNQRIQILNPAGKPVYEWNVPGLLPQGDERVISGIEPALAIGPKGRLYATDATTNRIMVFTSDGWRMQMYGVTKQLAGPKGIAVDDKGRIYVANTQAGQVTRYLPVAKP